MLHVVDLNGITHPIKNKQISRSRKVNGETTIDFDVLPDSKYPEAWQALDNESKLVFQNEPFIIKDMTRGNIGDTEAKQLGAEHTFFNNMINAQQYAIHNGSQTFQAALTRVFAPTQYTFVIVDSFLAQSFDNFGRENCLALFQKVLERYGAEFRVSGNTVYLYKQIGAHTGFQWRYKHNIKSIGEEKTSRPLATVIRGYFGKPNDDGVYPIELEYVSPNVDKFGELHAESITDERVEDEDTALRMLKDKLIDEPQLSQTIDFADLQAAGYDQGRPNEGDWGYIIYEPMNIRVEARIAEVNEVFRWIDKKWVPVKTTVTLSNIRQTLTDKNTRFAQTTKDVGRILSGVDSIPLSAMDIAVKNMTRLMQNASTELQFPESGGMLAVSKLDSNRMVIYNSEGIFFSADGGATPYAGMTGDGIVADAINVGTLRGILIEGVEIKGSLIESRENVNGYENYIQMTNNQLRSHGRYTRTWGGVEEEALINLGIRRGQMWISNEENGYNLYFTERGLSTTMSGAVSGFSAGTLEFHSQRYNETSRGVTLHSTFGAVALVSDYSTIYSHSALTNNIESENYSVYIRPFMNSRGGLNEFGFGVKDNPSGSDTDGYILYGNLTGGATHGSGIRFSKQSSNPTIYATNNSGDMGTGDFNGRRFYGLDFYGSLQAAGTHAYAQVDNDGQLRVTDRNGYNNGSPNYRDIQARSLLITDIRSNDLDTNFYFGVSTGELRVTNNLRYNNGDIGYKAVRASEFINASSIEYKTDISVWDGDARNILKNEAVIHQYKLIDDAGTERDLYRRGLIIEKETPAEFIYGKGTNLNEIVMFIIRAFQQESDLNDKRFTQLENRLTELESA